MRLWNTHMIIRVLIRDKSWLYWLWCWDKLSTHCMINLFTESRWANKIESHLNSNHKLCISLRRRYWCGQWPSTAQSAVWTCGCRELVEDNRMLVLHVGDFWSSVTVERRWRSEEPSNEPIRPYDDASIILAAQWNNGDRSRGRGHPISCRWPHKPRGPCLYASFPVASPRSPLTYSGKYHFLSLFFQKYVFIHANLSELQDMAPPLNKDNNQSIKHKLLLIFHHLHFRRLRHIFFFITSS